MFLGHIPANIKIHKKAGHIYGFKGCIQELQVNNKEFFFTDDALRGKNIENCHVPWCAHHTCHNNGTCIRLVLASWSPPYIPWFQVLKQKPVAFSPGDKKERYGFLSLNMHHLGHAHMWWILVCLFKEIYILWL